MPLGYISGKMYVIWGNRGLEPFILVYQRGLVKNGPTSKRIFKKKTLIHLLYTKGYLKKVEIFSIDFFLTESLTPKLSV